jgi:fructoselysine and glucoselysine-specific PTS system IIA component
MRRWILASHGTLADGMRSAVEVICGTRDDVRSIACHIDDAPPPAELLRAALAEMPQEAEVIIVTDLIGGSVDREARVIASDDARDIRVLGGMSLPLMLALLTLSDAEDDTDALVDTALRELAGAVLAPAPPVTPTLDAF